MLDILVITPLALALLIAGKICFRDRNKVFLGRFLFIACLFCTAFIILFAQDHSKCRIIFVIDQDVAKTNEERHDGITPSEQPQEVLRKSVRHWLSQIKVHSFSVLVVDMEKGMGVTEKPTPSLRWFTSAEEYKEKDLPKVGSVNDAISTCVDSFQNLPFLTRLKETLFRRSNEILVVTTSPKKWAGESLDIGGNVHLLQNKGIRLDVYVHEIIADRTHSLEVQFDTPFTVFPKISKDNPEPFTVRFYSPRLKNSGNANVEISLKLLGPLSSQSDPTNLPIYSTPQPLKKEISIKENAVEVQCNLNDLFPYRLAGQDWYDLPEGFFRLKIDAKVLFEEKSLSASTIIYRNFKHKSRKIYVCIGDGGLFHDFHSNGSKEKIEEEIINKLSLAQIVPRDDRIGLNNTYPTDICCITEGDLDCDFEENSIIVLHDLSLKEWKSVSSCYESWKKNGVHVMICGLPSQSNIESLFKPDQTKQKENFLRFFPAFAREVPDFTRPHKADKRFLFSRHPQIIFLKDPSPIGNFVYSPKTDDKSGKIPLEAPDDLNASRKFKWTGEEIQNEIIKQIIEKIASEKDESKKFKHVMWNKLDFIPCPIPSDRASNMIDKSLFEWSNVAKRFYPLFGNSEDENLKQIFSNHLISGQPGRARIVRHYSAYTGDNPTIIYPNDIVVVFSYKGIEQKDWESDVKSLLLSGATIIRVWIDGKFPVSVSLHKDDFYNKKKGEEVVKHEKAFVEAMLCEKSDTLVYSKLFEAELNRKDVSAEKIDEAPEIKKIVENLLKTIIPRISADSATIQAVDDGRFIAPNTPQAAAPLKFQILEQAKTPHISDDIYAETKWDATREDVPKTCPIIVGGIRGYASVLCLGYSPFEGIPLGLNEFFAVDKNEQPSFDGRKEGLNAKPTFWGINRLDDLAHFSERLELPPPSFPEIRVKEISCEIDGSLKITASTSLDPGQEYCYPEYRIGSIEITSTPSSDDPSKKTVERNWQNDNRVSLEISDINPLRSEIVLTLPRSGFIDLFPTPQEKAISEAPAVRGCWVGMSSSPEPDVPFIYIYIEKLEGKSEKERLMDLSNLRGVEAIAKFCGGTRYHLTPECQHIEDIEVRPSTPASVFPWIIVFSSMVALFWTSQTVSRWRHWFREKRATEAECRSLDEYDIPSVVESIGDISIRPDSKMKASPFLKHRSFEVGDPGNGIHPDDLVLMHFGHAILPRIAEHTDDLAGKLRIVVDLGESMRCPSIRENAPPKVLLAANVSELLAQIAWRSRYEITLITLGCQTSSPLIPSSTSPGRNAIRDHVLHATQNSSTVDVQWPTDETEGGVIYISDFLNTDKKTINDLIYRAEATGTKCGAIAVFSPSEFLLTGLRSTKSFLSDRSLYTPGDLQNQYRVFVAELHGLWGDTQGGLAVLSTSSSTSTLLKEIYSSRLLSVLHH